MASSSSCLSLTASTQHKYEVFLSFRGVDTRESFTSHLYAALRRNNIETFMDYRLERGDEVSQSLLNAIKESRLSLVILSENYATSSWCLDELVQILDCKKRNGQVVIPVFYGIDPSHVRKQKGTYATAFAKLERRFKYKIVREWRDALTKVANLSGWDSTRTRLLFLPIFSFSFNFFIIIQKIIIRAVVLTNKFKERKTNLVKTLDC